MVFLFLSPVRHSQYNVLTPVEVVLVNEKFTKAITPVYSLRCCLTHNKYRPHFDQYAYHVFVVKYDISKLPLSLNSLLITIATVVHAETYSNNPKQFATTDLEVQLQ